MREKGRRRGLTLGLLDLEEVKILLQVGQLSFVLKCLVMGLLQGGLELLDLLVLVGEEGLVLGRGLILAPPLALQISLEGGVLFGQRLVAGKMGCQVSFW